MVRWQDGVRSGEVVGHDPSRGGGRMSHTPGPWCTMYHNTTIRGFDGTDVAQIHAHIPEHKDANARLIAAAPDLLAALQAARAVTAKAALGVNFAQSDPEFPDLRGQAIKADNAIRAALAKATGAA
jgi:hypothetical protein